MDINTGRFLDPFQSLLPLIALDLVYKCVVIRLGAGSGERGLGIFIYLCYCGW